MASGSDQNTPQGRPSQNFTNEQMAQIQVLLDNQRATFENLLAQRLPSSVTPQQTTVMRTDTTWKAADIGLFDPGLPDVDGSTVINNVTHYTH